MFMQILRLLDNEELSPDEINNVKDLVEDYLERNQDDFEEFSDVDEMYEELGRHPSDIGYGFLSTLFQDSPSKGPLLMTRLHRF